MDFDFPSLSTDQVAAFVQLAQAGSLRGAAQRLCITEQGLRNRLLALEQRLGVPLYRKHRGPRRESPLTEQGLTLLSPAIAYLQSSRELCGLFRAGQGGQEVHVAASQYLTMYLLIDVVRRFHRAYPQIRIRLSSRTEQEIESTLFRDPEISIGVAAPYEPGPKLAYRHLMSLDWSLIVPRRHRLAGNLRPRLRDLASEPLILFERGSTGRQHVIEALHSAGIEPQVSMEATSTEMIVRMVEAGLGVSIVPLIAGGVITRGRQVVARSLGRQIRPIASGILTRRGEALSASSQQFVDYVVAESPRLGKTVAAP